MNDSFITALNTQKSTQNWMDVIADNMTNIYTPGFREKQVNFKTFLGGAIANDYDKKISQGNLRRVLLTITFILRVKAFS